MTEPALLTRVLLALDAASEDPAIEAGLELARRLTRDVHGLFVEDAQLLDVASLPFTRRIVSGGAGLPLEIEDIESSWRASAARVQARLRSAAAHRELRWSFSIVRARPAQVVGQMAPDEPLVVARGGDDWRGPVRVVAEPDGENGGPTTLARRLAADQRSVEVLVVAHPDLAAALRSLQERPGGVLVLRRDHPLARELLRGEGLTRLPCSVVLL